MRALLIFIFFLSSITDVRLFSQSMGNNVPQTDEMVLLEVDLDHAGLAASIEDALSLGSPSFLEYLQRENFLLDFRNAQVVPVSHLGALDQKLYQFEKIAEVPFTETEQGLVIVAETEQGSLRLALSSSTDSSIYVPFIEKEQISSQLVIGSKDVDLQRFQYLPTSESPNTIDGYLGRDFLRKYLLYFDYKNSILHLGTNAKIVTLPIYLDYANTPYTDSEIEGDNYQMLLDLGAFSSFTLNKHGLKQMNKIPAGSLRWLDFRGNGYESRLYRIPEIRLGKLTIHNALVKEDDDKFEKNSNLNEHRWDFHDQRASKGIVGRPLLEKINLLLDFPHKRVIACNSISKLKREGFSRENAIRIPFEIERAGIMLDVETDLGKKKFLLDTGCTVSLIRPDKEVKKNAIRMDGNSIFTTVTFALAEVDFGIRNLEIAPISTKLDELDGILGMDFLQEYTIYIDYPSHFLYIWNKKNP